jgi:YVTN family beta-propeller protein
VYVANWASDSVSVIDGARNTVIDTISVGVEPGGVGVNTATDIVYVSNAGDGTLSIIDTATDTVTGTLSITAASGYTDPHFVDVNSVTNRIYISEYYDGSSITVVNGATESVVTTIDNNGSYSYGLGVNPGTNKIYSAKWNPAAVLNGATNTYIGDVSGGSWSECADVAVNPGTDKIYVVDGNGNVHVINGSTDAEIGTITVGTSPFGIDIDADRNMIYVANMSDGTVSVINGATDTVVDTVTVGTAPMGVAVNPATSRVYVANSGSNNISVIDGLTNTVLTAIPVQITPYLLAVLP